MEKLKAELNRLMNALNDEEAKKEIEQSASGHPFNSVEHTLAILLGKDELALDEYRNLRRDYLERNPHLPLFEITAPRVFGETWAQEYLAEIVSSLQKPTKKIDSQYKGQYDFWLEGIRIEVKASRATDSSKDSKEPLYKKSLGATSQADFDMNFQQVKPDCCDVFVLIGVWMDKIRFWVLSSNELRNCPDYSSGQHRGNMGEGQIHFKRENIASFHRFEKNADDLEKAIRDAYQRTDTSCEI